MQDTNNNSPTMISAKPLKTRSQAGYSQPKPLAMLSPPNRNMARSAIPTHNITVFLSRLFISKQPSGTDEGDCGVDADDQKHYAEGNAGIARQSLRPLADDDSPVNREQPDAVGKVPDGCRNSDNVKDKNRRNTKLARDDFKRLRRILSDRLRVQSGDESEAEIKHMKGDKEKKNDAGYALNRIKPVAGIKIRKVVRTHLPRDKKSVNGVVD